jgi:hypothetical protein
MSPPGRVGPMRNKLGTSLSRLYIVGAILSATLFGLFAPLDYFRGWTLLAVFMGCAGPVVVVVTLFGLPRLDGDPHEFAADSTGLVLRYEYPGLRKEVHVPWAAVKIREETLRGTRMRIVTFQKVSFPRFAYLEMDEGAFRAMTATMPKDVVQF